MATSFGTDKTDFVDLKALLKRYQDCATSLVQCCEKFSHIPGVVKLERKCRAELKYLNTLANRRGGFDITHLRSSNLGHYAGIVHAIEHLPRVTHVLQAFSCPNRRDALHVDVVAYNGHAWIKVIARKGQAVHLTCIGQGQFGEKDISLQAEDYILCSRQHTVNFQIPKLMFAFYNGVTNDIASMLRNRDIIVIGEQVPVDVNIVEQLSAIELLEDSSDPKHESDQDSYDKRTSAGFNVFDKDQNFGIVSDIEDRPSEKNFAEGSSKVLMPLSLNFTSCGCKICRERRRNPVNDKKPQSKPSQTKSDDANYSLVSKDEPVIQIKANRNELEMVEESITLPNHSHSIIDLENKSSDDLQQYQDKPLFGSDQVLSFIHNELLLYCNIDYNILGKIEAANEIKTIYTINKVNLDVTTLICLVSAVTHDGCHFRFQEKILSQQATEERQIPLLPKLLMFLQGKFLFACKTAVDSFFSIIDILGGKNEISRAKELMGVVTVVPDNPSFRASCLPRTGKLKYRSKVIFGTGDSLGAVTVTANTGFLRAAHEQGVTFCAFEHAARALTEIKESTAEPLSIESWL
ncbi:hypothetical protein ACF0H5_018517 [Mactra antiquata]